jgi:hypothetical protein
MAPRSDGAAAQQVACAMLTRVVVASLIAFLPGTTPRVDIRTCRHGEVCFLDPENEPVCASDPIETCDVSMARRYMGMKPTPENFR